MAIHWDVLFLGTIDGQCDLQMAGKENRRIGLICKAESFAPSV